MLSDNMITIILEVSRFTFSFVEDSDAHVLDITPIVIGNAGCMEGHNTFTKNQPDYVAYRNNVVCFLFSSFSPVMF